MAAGIGLPRVAEKAVYPARNSFITYKQTPDFTVAHSVEIVGDQYLARQKAKALDVSARGAIEGYDFHHWLPGF